MAKKLSKKTSKNTKTVDSAKKSDMKNAELGKIFKHRTFERSYREDYLRDLETPSISAHIFQSFKMIFGNWRIFVPLVLVMTLAAMALMGLPKEFDSEVWVFGAVIFLIIWLVTIFLVRHLMAGHEVKLRDGLYNALTPLLSSLVVLAVAAVQAIPIAILAVVYAAAVETNFLSAPLYVIGFIIFAFLMVLLSGYLLSGTLMALVAVSAPGLYPLEALKMASDLMAGRRMRLMVRILAVLLVLAVIWAVILLPINAFDTAMKQEFAWTAEILLVPACVMILACFSAVYMAVYFYLYYRYMLKFDSMDFSFKKEKQK